MSKSLRIVFMGTPEFAVASLEAIVESRHKVVGVVTVADKPAGRGQQLKESPVKKFALNHHLPVLQPVRLKDPEFLNALQAFNADLFVVVAFRMLPEVVWNMPPLGSINLHGSLLPAYRGAAPINHAIINGEETTGVTTFFIRQEIDTGEIIDRQEIPIGKNETAGQLHDRMMLIGANTLVKTLDAIADKTYTETKQSALVSSNGLLPAAPKIFKENCEINWNKDKREIHNLVRGLSPYPATWTKLDDKILKIYFGTPQEFEHTNHDAPGSWHTDGKTYLYFTCANGNYYVTDLQLEGKKRLGIEEFLRGWRSK